jgi:hypothetical protein
MLYIRKPVGVRFLVRASALGPGVDTPTSLDQVISVMAIKMRRWIFVARVNAVSFIYPIARPAVSHLGASPGRQRGLDRCGRVSRSGGFHELSAFGRCFDVLVKRITSESTL